MEGILRNKKSSKKETNRSAEDTAPATSSQVDNSGESGDDNQLILDNMDVDLGHFMTATNENVTSRACVEQVQCTVDVIEPPWMGREDEEVPNQVLPNHKLRSSGHCQVDLMDHFDRVFEKKTFDSFKEFDDLFSRFKKETGSVFRIKSSCSIAYENSRRKQHFIPPRFKFVSIKYCCVHYGQPKVSGQGIRTKQRYLPCGCGSVLSVAYNRGALFISQVNMRHNHEVSNKIAPHYAINRRITKHELRQVADVIAVMPSSRALQYFLKERFHRPMTLQDAKNTRARLKTMQMKTSQTESIKVMSSINEFSQIHNEDHSRTVLEIKEEREEADHSLDVDHEDDSYQTKELPSAQQDEQCEVALKNKALSEIVAKISELMNSCDSSVFWERITIMNKVMECWENGENLDVHYTSEYKTDIVDISSEEKKSRSLQGMELQQNIRVLQDKTQGTDPNCNIAPQDLADRHLKFLLPILNDSVQFVPTSVDGSVKIVVPQMESKVVKLNNIIKRPRGRPRMKDDISSTLKPTNELSGCVTYQREPQVLDAGQVKDSDSETRFTVDNESDCSDLYSGPPFISCITKEPCMDVSEQAMEVEIEINDSDIT